MKFKNQISPTEKPKKLRGFANFYQKIRPFSDIFWVKNTLVNPSIFFIFGRDFERILGILPFTDGFLGHIFCPKKQILKAKS